MRSRTGSQQVEEREDEDAADEDEEEAQEPVTRRAPKGPTKNKNMRRRIYPLENGVNIASGVEAETNHTKGKRRKSKKRTK